MAGFKNLEDLVSDLSDGLRKLRAGELEPEELTPLVEDARELSDRLILLRFKAHEFSYEVRRKAPESGVDRETADRLPVRPFRIGAAYQTSLIDAIEEVSREQSEQAEKARLDAGTPELFDAPAPHLHPHLHLHPNWFPHLNRWSLKNLKRRRLLPRSLRCLSLLPMCLLMKKKFKPRRPYPRLRRRQNRSRMLQNCRLKNQRSKRQIR